MSTNVIMPIKQSVLGIINRTMAHNVNNVSDNLNNLWKKDKPTYRAFKLIGRIGKLFKTTVLAHKTTSNATQGFRGSSLNIYKN